MPLPIRRPFALVCLQAALLLVAAGGAVAASPSRVVGTVATLVNDVRVKLVGAAQPRPAVLRQRLSLGEQVQTGADSRMQAMLLDRSAFTVGPNSRLTIDRFVYDPDGSSFSATIAKGAMRFISGGGKRGGSRMVNTPVASIGIRGTIVDTVVGDLAIAIARRERAVGSSVGGDPESASLIVLRGPGPGAHGNVIAGAVSIDAGGASVALDRPAQAVYVPSPGAQPIGPFTLSAPGLAQVNDLIMAPVEARPTQVGDDPYLQRSLNRPAARPRPVLPGELGQDRPPPALDPYAGYRPSLPDNLLRDDPGSDIGPGTPPPSNPGPGNPPPSNPGADNPGSNSPGPNNPGSDYPGPNNPGSDAPGTAP
jgi:hypothetical protein